MEGDRDAEQSAGLFGKSATLERSWGKKPRKNGNFGTLKVDVPKYSHRAVSKKRVHSGAGGELSEPKKLRDAMEETGSNRAKGSLPSGGMGCCGCLFPKVDVHPNQQAETMKAFLPSLNR